MLSTNSPSYRHLESLCTSKSITVLLCAIRCRRYSRPKCLLRALRCVLTFRPLRAKAISQPITRRDTHAETYSSRESRSILHQISLKDCSGGHRPIRPIQRHHQMSHSVRLVSFKSRTVKFDPAVILTFLSPEVMLLTCALNDVCQMMVITRCSQQPCQPSRPYPISCHDMCGVSGLVGEIESSLPSLFGVEEQERAVARNVDEQNHGRQQGIRDRIVYCI